MSLDHKDSATKRFVNRHPGVRPYISPFKRFARDAYEPTRGYFDYRLLRRRISSIDALELGHDTLPSRIRDAYGRYVAEVSNSIMAISYELSLFLYALCVASRPAKVVDLGSGFSSLILREYARSSRDDVEVWSVDDSEFWLLRTKEFLESMDISSDRLLTWQSFRGERIREFDLVIYDLGQVGSLRRSALRDALALPRRGGMVILDDMNYVGYKRYVKKTTKGMDVDLYSLKRFTKDSTGRYSYLLIQS